MVSERRFLGLMRKLRSSTVSYGRGRLDLQIYTLPVVFWVHGVHGPRRRNRETPWLSVKGRRPHPPSPHRTVRAAQKTSVTKIW